MRTDLSFSKFCFLFFSQQIKKMYQFMLIFTNIPSGTIRLVTYKQNIHPEAFITNTSFNPSYKKKQ
jgi:hypothetical protein